MKSAVNLPHEGARGNEVKIDRQDTYLWHCVLQVPTLNAPQKPGAKPGAKPPKRAYSAPSMSLPSCVAGRLQAMKHEVSRKSAT